MLLQFLKKNPNKIESLLQPLVKEVLEIKNEGINIVLNNGEEKTL